MTDYKDGDTITVNGKPCRIEGGALVPVVKRGPLGGELKECQDCEVGTTGYIRVEIKKSKDSDLLAMYPVPSDGSVSHLDYYFDRHFAIEVNIPRPAFKPMTAGEAAKLPDIVGRWVAVRVCKKSSDELVLGDEIYERWFDRDDQILLIEGADL